MDINAVYTGITDAVNGAALLGTTLQLTATDFQPDQPTVPHFYLAEFTGEYDRTFGGDMNITITARLMVARAGADTGQREARALAGPGTDTIRDVIEGIRNHSTGAFSGACQDLWLQRVVGPRLYDFGTDSNFYGLEFTIFVMG